jgi:sensor domain DACNV-containing protein
MASTAGVNSPADLAALCYHDLRVRWKSGIRRNSLTRLLEVLFFASLRKEEAQPITCSIVYLDPDRPDPHPPLRIRGDRWTVTPLASRLPFDVGNLVKVALASDPRSSSFAAYHDRAGHVFIWGLIDQGHQYHSFINLDSESGPERPGLFQVTVTGAGHIKVYVGYEKIGELRVERLVRQALDVLRTGPVSDRLAVGIADFVTAVEREVPPDAFNGRRDWTGRLASEWVAALCRILLRIQNYGHGGALLITERVPPAHLNVKYRLRYDRLSAALHGDAVNGIREASAGDAVRAIWQDSANAEIPIDLYFDESIHRFVEGEYRTALEGAIWFVSLLSRVDGLVLLDPSLNVKGFGAEITIGADPPSLGLASTANAPSTRVRKVAASEYGMRHRSMMRFCANVPESVGFVVSQDGHVRAITQVEGSVVMWDNVRIQIDDFISFNR